jgi:deoxyribose-phosphate aldolase
MVTEVQKQEILGKTDHTLLKPECTWDDIKKICDGAIKYRTASVCIPPSHVQAADQYLAGRVPVCTVIGFPNGYNSTKTKVFEARDAIASGATEIDMVLNIGWVKAGKFDEIEHEIREIKQACGSHILKVIIEACLLTDDEKIACCKAVTAAGADFIKTSTGFSKGGATLDDVALLRKHVGPNVQVKAAGGIGSWDDALKFIELGASRLGTSRLVSLAANVECAGSTY